MRFRQKHVLPYPLMSSKYKENQYYSRKNQNQSISRFQCRMRVYFFLDTMNNTSHVSE